jgi:hypothetical protein
MVVIRRTFHCKSGHAGPATDLFREVARITREADACAGAIRIYTDLSGQADRIVMEIERSSFDPPRNVSAVVHRHPDAGATFARLREHLTGAETEFLQLEDCGLS